MSYPGVYIEISNGQLGTVATTNDGIAGMIISGVDNGSVPISTPKQIFSLKEAEDLGFTADYDTANSVFVHRQIADFYEQTGNGSELWLIVVPTTVLMAEMADINGNYAPVLLNAANGKIRILAISRVPDATYTSTITHGLDDDVWNALAKAQTLAEEYTTQMKPLRVLIGGRAWNGVVADLQDLNELSNNRVGISIVGMSAGSKEANIAYALGRAAAIPVHRNIGRVKDGDITGVNAYLSDGTSIDNVELQIKAIHAKGYITFRKYVNRGGYYFVDDSMATAETDDYKSLARGRVIDKAIVLTYSTYIDEVNNEVSINTDGTLEASYVKSLQSKIESVLNQSMTAKGEVSSAKCYIDETQNVLSTNKMEVAISVIPVGYTKEINVKLGFINPQNI